MIRESGGRRGWCWQQAAGSRQQQWREKWWERWWCERLAAVAGEVAAVVMVARIDFFCFIISVFDHIWS